jgi:RND family efflux transporter MFP subunit
MKTTLLTALSIATLLLAGGCQRPDPGGHSHGGHSHGSGAAHAHGEDHAEDTTSFTLFTDTHELFVELDLPVAGQVGSHHAHVTRLEDNAAATGGGFGVAFLDAGDSNRVAQSYAVSEVARTGIFTPSGRAPSDPGTYRLVYRYQSGDEVAEWEAGLIEVGRKAITPDEPAEGEITFLKETSWFLPFRVRRPELHRLARSVTLPAHVEADPRLSATVAAPASGRVLWSDGEEATLPGRRVKAGEIVGRLVPDSSYQSWNALDLALRRSRIDSDRANAELARLESLLGSGLVAERRVLDARAERDNAAAALRSARRERETRSGDAPTIELRAPAGGIVIAMLLEHGERTEAGQALARIASTERVVVHGTLRGVLPEELDRVTFARAHALDSGREIDLLAAGASLLARPEIVDRHSAGLPVSWSVPNDGRLMIGELLELSLGVGETEDQLTVPKSAIVEINTRPHAFVQVTGESFEQRLLRLGRSDGRRVAVLSGLSEEDLVVTQGGFDVYVASLAGTVESHVH